MSLIYESKQADCLNSNNYLHNSLNKQLPFIGREVTTNSSFLPFNYFWCKSCKMYVRHFEGYSGKVYITWRDYSFTLPKQLDQSFDSNVKYKLD